MIKIKEIEESKQLIFKQKFMKALKIIKELSGHLPVIDEGQDHNIKQCMEDMQEILSNFYSGDEFPFNAICELMNKLVIKLCSHLIMNGYHALVTKISVLVESLLKSLSLGIIHKLT
jgi:hypothetical protein